MRGVGPGNAGHQRCCGLRCTATGLWLPQLRRANDYSCAPEVTMCTKAGPQSCLVRCAGGAGPAAPYPTVRSSRAVGHACALSVVRRREQTTRPAQTAVQAPGSVQIHTPEVSQTLVPSSRFDHLLVAASLPHHPAIRGGAGIGARNREVGRAGASYGCCGVPALCTYQFGAFSLSPDQH